MFTLFCILIILKLIGLTTISWLWVFAPLIVLISWNLFWSLLTIIIAAIASVVNR